MAYYRHPQALVETDEIGPGSRIWAFAHVMAGARIGRDCNICEHCFVEKGAVIGDKVTVKNHVAVWDGVTIADGVFLGPNVALTNDLRPRSRAEHWTRRETFIGQGATVGANATLLCGIRVGQYAFIGAGSVVTQDVPAHTLVYGNPARRRGYVCRCAEPITFTRQHATCRACGSRFRKDRSGVTDRV
jgi:UDP-2-acetamido-3-amino-2,3-dideoxy-glucuronate N-acetyltransferase